MRRFRMVRFRVRVHERDARSIDLPEPNDEDAIIREHDLSNPPWEFRSKSDAEAMARSVAELHRGSVWCEVYEVEKRVKPMLDNVVIVVLPRPDRTKSGIILAEQRGREDMGEVLAIGPLVKGVREGEIVKFDPYALRLVIDDSGMDVTNSMHAKAGSLAIVREDAIRYAIG